MAIRPTSPEGTAERAHLLNRPYGTSTFVPTSRAQQSIAGLFSRRPSGTGPVLLEARFGGGRSLAVLERRTTSTAKLRLTVPPAVPLVPRDGPQGRERKPEQIENARDGGIPRRIRKAWLIFKEFSNRLWPRPGLSLFRHLVEVVEAQP